MHYYSRLPMGWKADRICLNGDGAKPCGRGGNHKTTMDPDRAAGRRNRIRAKHRHPQTSPYPASHIRQTATPLKPPTSTLHLPRRPHPPSSHHRTHQHCYAHHAPNPPSRPGTNLPPETYDEGTGQSWTPEDTGTEPQPLTMQAQEETGQTPYISHQDRAPHT